MSYHSPVLVLLAVLLVGLAACRTAEDGASLDPGSDPDRSPDPGGVTPSPDPTVAPPGPDAMLPEDAWARMADLPAPRTEVAAAALSGQLWVAGGFGADGAASSEVFVYDPAFDQWSEGPELPEPVHHAALIGSGDTLWLIGGYRGSTFSEPVAATWYLDPADGQWQEGPPLPEARAAGAGAFNGEHVVYGGGVGPGRGARADVFRLVGEAWEPAGELSVAREHLGVVADHEGRVWFLAGRTGPLDSILATVDLLDADGVRHLGELPTARGGVAGFWGGGAGACLAGGEQSAGTFDEVECMDSGGAITTLPRLGVARHGPGAAVVDGIAYVVAGGTEPGLSVSAALEAFPL